jgi:membrane-bound ClpP family serine protease
MTFFYLLVILAAFYLFLIAEFFLPSGGMLGVAAVATLIAAIVIAFSHSLLTGAAVIGFVLLTTPLVLMGMVRVWPHTPIGRRMLNRRPGQEAAAIPRRTTARGVPIDDLVGRIGVAKTNLLPSGMVTIDGEKLDAVSTGMPIDSGSQVVVTHVELGRLHVRAATASDHVVPHEPEPQSPPSLEGSLDAFDVE